LPQKSYCRAEVEEINRTKIEAVPLWVAGY
jgi:hypothetical protein